MYAGFGEEADMPDWCKYPDAEADADAEVLAAAGWPLNTEEPVAAGREESAVVAMWKVEQERVAEEAEARRTAAKKWYDDWLEDTKEEREDRFLKRRAVKDAEREAAEAVAKRQQLEWDQMRQRGKELAELKRKSEAVHGILGGKAAK